MEANWNTADMLEQLAAERDALRRERDDLRDIMRGAAKNLMKVLEEKP